MSSSSDPKHASPSPSQNDKPPLSIRQPLSIQQIVKKLDTLLQKLSGARNELEKASTSQQGKKDGTDDKPNPLDKACNELKYLKSAFEKLDKFETDLDKPIRTLESNVEDILTDLNAKDFVEEVVKGNLKALRSNITKVKAQIPLQHQASSISEGRYLQTTNTSKDVGTLPDPYGADGIFENESFLKEFQDRYRDLDERQKLCLLSFAIFPENAVVKKRLLRFWWEGERLLSKTKTKTETETETEKEKEEKLISEKKKDRETEEKEKEKEKLVSEKEEEEEEEEEEEKKRSVKGILKLFVEKGFIEPVTKRSRSDVTSYRMHPIIRCLVIRLAQAANFFHFDPKGYPDKDFFKSKKLCLVKSEGPSWWSKDVPVPDEKQKQQSKSGEDEQQKTVGQEKDKDKETKRVEQEKERVAYLGNLQTLFNVSKQFPDMREELFSKMKNIGVLYLGRWEPTAQRHMEVENTAFLKGLENMNKLRFFSLQGISGIPKLPKSLGKLYNLRILDLRACHNLEELPKEVGSLKRLTHLDLSECYLLEYIHKDLSNLSNLKVLKGFVISKKKKSSCTLEQLTKLSNLVKLSINVNRKDFSIYETEAYFSKFTNLRKLKIAWGATGEEAKGKEAKGEEAKPTSEKNKTDKGKKPQTNKTQESEAPKSNLCKWNLKQKIGFSKPVHEIKVADPKAKASKVDGNRDANKQPLMKLEKLDLHCYPARELPPWLISRTVTNLKRLYIRGGGLSNLGQIDTEWENVITLRLKYLLDVKMNWKELRMQFPKLEYLEKVNCPQIAFCPCDASGVWVSNQRPTN